MSTLHTLKCWPEYFEALGTGAKTFEIRKADRPYAVRDLLVLSEWNPKAQQHAIRPDSHYTGASVLRVVTYVLPAKPEFGVADGFVALGIRPPKACCGFCDPCGLLIEMDSEVAFTELRNHHIAMSDGEDHMAFYTMTRQVIETSSTDTDIRAMLQELDPTTKGNA